MPITLPPSSKFRAMRSGFHARICVGLAAVDSRKDFVEDGAARPLGAPALRELRSRAGDFAVAKGVRWRPGARDLAAGLTSVC